MVKTVEQKGTWWTGIKGEGGPERCSKEVGQQIGKLTYSD